MTTHTETDQGISQDSATTQETAVATEPTLKELNERYLQMEAAHKKAIAELEERKKEISGLNRKISADEQLIKQKELEKLNEKDRAKAELQMILDEKAKTENEIRELSRSRVIDKALIDAGIPVEFSKRITGQTEDEIKSDVEDLKIFIDTITNEKSEKKINEKLSGKPPVAGAAPMGKLSLDEINKIPDREERIKALKAAGYRK